MIAPYDRRRRVRKQLARRIRDWMGVSREPPPSPLATLQAAIDLGDLVDETTGGRFTVLIRDRQGGAHSLITPAQAWQLARTEGTRDDA